MNKRFIIIFGIVFILLSSFVSAYELFDKYESTGSLVGNFLVADRYQATKFKATSNYDICSVEIYLGTKTSSPSINYVDLFSHDSGTGKPDTRLKRFHPPSTNPTGNAWNNFTETTGCYSLVSDTTYWLATRGIGNDGGNKIGYLGTSGLATQNYTNSDDGGSTWTLSTAILTYRTYGIIPPPPIQVLNITSFNLYDDSLINIFGADINYSNGSNQHFYTTNGIIIAGGEYLANISLHSFDGDNVTFFKQNYESWNSNNTLEAQTYQAKLTLVANESNTNNPVGAFNSTIGSYSNESNALNKTISYLDAGTYNIDAQSNRYFINVSQGIIITSLTDTEQTVYFANHINVTAFNINTSQQILNFSVLTDDGYSNSTLDGNLTVFCSYPTCDLSYNASGVSYLNKTYTSVWNKNHVGQLSLAKLYLYFVEADSLTPINNASITVITPDTRTLNLHTDANGLINFSLLYNENFINGSYQFTFLALSGFNSPVTFNETITTANIPFNNTRGIARVGLTFNIYNRETKTLLSGISTGIFMLESFNFTTTTGTFVIANLTLVTGEKTVFARTSGYYSEQLNFDFTGQANVTINFYMLNLTGSNSGFVFTTTIFDNRLQQDARVSMYEYFPSISAYVKVSECNSNVNGECAFTIELNTGLYYFTATKTIDGVEYSTQTNPEIIITDEETRTLVLSRADLFETSPTNSLQTTISETYLNNISTIFVDFQTTGNFVTTVCVEYFRDDILNWTSVYSQCVNASASYVATPILLNRTFGYKATVYQYHAGDSFLIKQYNYPSQSSFDQLFTGRGFAPPVFVWIWGALLVIALLIHSVEFFCIGGIILSWITFSNMPSVALASVSALKTIILFSIMTFSRRKEDIT